MKSVTLIIGLFTLLSCNSKNNELIITFENSGGIHKGSDVISKNTVIGTVTRVWQNQKEVNVSISLTELDGIPKDSKFTIRQKDLLDNAVYITTGKSQQHLSKSDKIVGEIDTSP